MQELTPRKRYFENLDGLRFLLAVVVLSSHSMLGSSIAALCPNDFLKRIVLVFANGAFGVSFFFVLSGFLITYLMLEEQEVNSNFSIRNFYIRRALRIWPLYYGLLIFTFLIYPKVKTLIGITDQNPFSALYQIPFLSNFDSIRVNHLGLRSVAPMMININWSVAIEEQFYLAWPLLFIIFRGRKFIIPILLCILGCWVFRLYTTDHELLYYHTLAVIGDLAMGAAFAYFTFYRQQETANLLTRVNKATITCIYVGGILLLTYYDVINTFLFQMTRAISTLFLLLSLSSKVLPRIPFSNSPMPGAFRPWENTPMPCICFIPSVSRQRYLFSGSRACNMKQASV